MRFSDNIDRNQPLGVAFRFWEFAVGAELLLSEAQDERLAIDAGRYLKTELKFILQHKH